MVIVLGIRAHHILPWRIVELRYNINNGITLCQFHHPHGDKKITKSLFSEQ